MSEGPTALGGRLLVDATVVTVVGPGDRRFDRRTVQDAWGTACQ